MTAAPKNRLPLSYVCVNVGKRSVLWGAEMGRTSLGLLIFAGSFVASASPPTDLVDSRYYKVRLAVAQMLAEQPDVESRRRLSLLADDPHPLVRLTAVRALAR